MKVTLLDNVYDDQNDQKIRSFFQKAVRWIREASEGGKQNWKNILNKSYSKYLIKGGSGHTLLENLCEDCNSGSCATCFVKKENKGEKKMTILEKRIDEAFGAYEKPRIKEQPSYEAVHRIGKDGQLKQTQKSKLDEKIFWAEQKKEETLEESEDLSTDEKILAAFS